MPLQIRREDWSGVRAATKAARRNTAGVKAPVDPASSPPKLTVVPLGRFPTGTTPTDANAASTGLTGNTVEPVKAVQVFPRLGHLRSISRSSLGVSARSLPDTIGLHEPPLLARASSVGEEAHTSASRGFGQGAPGLHVPPRVDTAPAIAAATFDALPAKAPGMFSPYAIPPPQKPKNAEETVGRLWATLKTDIPLASMGDLLSVIGVCVIARHSSVVLPYFPNASGGTPASQSSPGASSGREGVYWWRICCL